MLCVTCWLLNDVCDVVLVVVVSVVIVVPGRVREGQAWSLEALHASRRPFQETGAAEYCRRDALHCGAFAQDRVHTSRFDTLLCS